MSYMQGAIRHLEELNLLTVEIENALSAYAAEKKLLNAINKSKEVINFGKYRDKLWADILKIDPKYVNWCMKQTWMRDDTKAFIEGLYGTIQV